MHTSFKPAGRTIVSLAATGILVTGMLSPLHADSGAEHRLRLERPIEMGTSVGVDHLVEIDGSLYCVGGTAGALVSNASSNFMLSNNHVLANEGTEEIGIDGVVQPAILEECSSLAVIEQNIAEDRVATLAAYADILFGGAPNRADVAVAVDNRNCGNDGNQPCLDSRGRILDVGDINPSIQAPALGMKVHKSGRTTGHTYGDIVATNVTINVQYDSGVATFTNQVRITSCNSKVKFSDSGDSGSLILSDPASNGSSTLPRPVALLFAGGQTDTFANLATDALQALTQSDANLGNLQFVGCTTGSCARDAEYLDRAKSACPVKGGGKGGRPRNSQQPTGLERARQVANNNAAIILGNAGVVGFGIGQDDAGSAVIEIYVETLGSNPGLPSQINGVGTRVVETGTIVAY